MESAAESIPTFAFVFGGWETVLILAVTLIIFGARRLPDLSRGIDQGIREFQRSMDDEARDAGKSLGGIYGKPAADALTHENQTAELYDRAALLDKAGPRKSTKRAPPLRRLWRRMMRLISNLSARTKH
jgi:sec-independent protein translocase protein TatA